MHFEQTSGSLITHGTGSKKKHVLSPLVRWKNHCVHLFAQVCQTNCCFELNDNLGCFERIPLTPTHENLSWLLSLSNNDKNEMDNKPNPPVQFRWDCGLHQLKLKCGANPKEWHPRSKFCLWWLILKDHHEPANEKSAICCNQKHVMSRTIQNSILHTFPWFGFVLRWWITTTNRHCKHEKELLFLRVCTDHQQKQNWSCVRSFSCRGHTDFKHGVSKYKSVKTHSFAKHILLNLQAPDFTLLGCCFRSFCAVLLWM